MSEKFATAQDFIKDFKKGSFELINGRRVEMRALTQLDIMNVQKDVLDALLLEIGVTDLDDVDMRQGFLDNMSNGEQVEFMLEVARRVIVYALIKPQYTMFPVLPTSPKVRVQDLTPSDTMDLYLAIEDFSGIKRRPVRPLRDLEDSEAESAESEVSDTVSAQSETETDTAPAADDDAAVETEAVSALGADAEPEKTDHTTEG